MNLLACTMCFGAEETSLIDGTRLGILEMLGVTFVVQGQPETAGAFYAMESGIIPQLVLTVALPA